MQVVFSIVLTASLTLLIAFSFSMIYFVNRFFHLAHAAVITVSAYFSYLFYKILSLPFFLSFLIAIAFAVTLGILCEVLIYSRMRKRNFPLFAYLIVSLGLNVIVQNCISLLFGDDPKNIRTAIVERGFEVFGGYITLVQIILITLFILLFCLCYLWFNFSRTGKALLAMADNPELCEIYGLNSPRLILITFLVGSTLAAVAGIGFAMDNNIDPNFGFNLLLYGSVAMIVGGVGSFRGIIGGTLLIAIIQQVTAYYLSSSWKDALTYIVLIMFLFWKPLGFSGKKLKKVEI